MNAADRRYLWFTIWLFVLLGLVGVGAVLYRPLRLRYAIYRVEHTTEEDFAAGRINRAAYLAWLDECSKSACAGCQPAMKALMTPVVWGGPRYDPVCHLTSLSYDLAAAQPELFFQNLDKCPNNQIQSVLADIVNYCSYVRAGRVKLYVAISRNCTSRMLVQSLEMMVFSENPKNYAVVQATLEFTRRRLAKELAEADKAKPK